MDGWTAAAGGDGRTLTSYIIHSTINASPVTVVTTSISPPPPRLCVCTWGGLLGRQIDCPVITYEHCPEAVVTRNPVVSLKNQIRSSSSNPYWSKAAPLPFRFTFCFPSVLLCTLLYFLLLSFCLSHLNKSFMSSITDLFSPPGFFYGEKLSRCRTRSHLSSEQIFVQHVGTIDFSFSTLQHVSLWRIKCCLRLTVTEAILEDVLVEFYCSAWS